MIVLGISVIILALALGYDSFDDEGWTDDAQTPINNIPCKAWFSVLFFVIGIVLLIGVH